MKTWIHWMIGATLLLGTAGCSVKKMAVNRLGDALAGGGSVFASDDDPELIRAAAPFSLKLMESLLAEVPAHQGLLLAAASGFTQYGYAFVQQEADELEEQDYQAAEAKRGRARGLYRRARDYGLRGLEAAHPGIGAQLRQDPRRAVRQLTRQDVGLAYWTAAPWGALIALSKDNPDRVSEIPQLEALIDRALDLDESYGAGAVHNFLITYEMSRQGAPGNPEDRARQHFRRARELSGGELASPLVNLAEAVCIQRQQAAEFRTLLNQALAIDVDRRPEWRLENLIMQRRARWLLARIDDLFLDPAANDNNKKE